jgi:hypothetical protein
MSPLGTPVSDMGGPIGGFGRLLEAIIGQPMWAIVDDVLRDMEDEDAATYARGNAWPRTPMKQRKRAQ